MLSGFATRVFTFKSNQLLLGLVLSLFSPLGFSKVHIEPYIGWSLTYTNKRPLQKDILTSGSQSFQYFTEGRYYSGPTPGMRLGYSSLGLALGFDFTFGNWISIYRNNKDNVESFTNKETIRPILPGLFVSYKLPLLFRAYASLIPQAPIQFTSADEQESSYCKESRGLKLGLSYLSIPFISVNFEYLPLYIGGENCGSWSHTATVYANFIF